MKKITLFIILVFLTIISLSSTVYSTRLVTPEDDLFFMCENVTLENNLLYGKYRWEGHFANCFTNLDDGFSRNLIQHQLYCLTEDCLGPYDICWGFNTTKRNYAFESYCINENGSQEYIIYPDVILRAPIRYHIETIFTIIENDVVNVERKINMHNMDSIKLDNILITDFGKWQGFFDNKVEQIGKGSIGIIGQEPSNITIDFKTMFLPTVIIPELKPYDSTGISINGQFKNIIKPLNENKKFFIKLGFNTKIYHMVSSHDVELKVLKKKYFLSLLPMGEFEEKDVNPSVDQRYDDGTYQYYIWKKPFKNEVHRDSYEITLVYDYKFPWMQYIELFIFGITGIMIDILIGRPFGRIIEKLRNNIANKILKRKK